MSDAQDAQKLSLFAPKSKRLKKKKKSLSKRRLALHGFSLVSCGVFEGLGLHLWVNVWFLGHAILGILLFFKGGLALVKGQSLEDVQSPFCATPKSCRPGA